MKKIEERIRELRLEVEHHNNLYYTKTPIISDGEFDLLLKKLEDLENRYREEKGDFLEGKSGAYSVGSSLANSKFKKIKHSSPMLSLANCYNMEELGKFNGRIADALGAVEYVAEPKLDGFSISLIYREGELVRGLTRGDGVEGEDVTENIKEIGSIPHRLRERVSVEVRGEVILPLDSFNNINKARKEEGVQPFSSPRNAAAGTIRQLNPQVVRARGLECFVYHLLGSLDHKDSLIRMEELGLPVVEHYSLCSNMLEVEDYIEKFGEMRRGLNYETDGVVVKVNSESDREILGFRSKSPRWAIAYKYPASQSTTRIRAIEFGVGRSGAITPVAILEPVFLSGALISKATLHNMKEIESKDIRVNDWIFIERGGDVIPKVVKSIPERRDGSENRVLEPTTCPSCNEPLVKKKDEVKIKCINLLCEGRQKRYLEFFVSKEAMDISNLGAETLVRLFDLNIVKSVEDIYGLRYDDLEGLEGFKKRSIDNLINSIEESKKNTFERVFFSLGMEHVGKYSASLIVKKWRTMDKIILLSLEELESLNGVGPKIAKSIYDCCRDDNFLQYLKRLKEIGLIFEDKSTISEGPLSGKNFLATGTLSKYKREEIKKIVEEKGGNYLNGVSNQLNFLIVGEKAGSKLRKVEKLNEKGGQIEIIDEEAFEKMLEINL